MHDVFTRRFSTAQSFATAALILALAAGGCERSPRGGSDSKSPSPGSSSARAPSATDSPAALSSPAASAPAARSTQATQPVPASQASATPRKHVAYYFHRTIRCATCLSIEKQSQEAIELGYNAELSAGTLEWRAVNIEEPGNEHFEKDFALDRQALVLVELAGEKVQRYKRLEQVWELVDDPYGFQKYVFTEVALFLGGG